MQLDQMLHQVQADAGAGDAGRGGGAEEALEQLVALLLGNADAFVAHRDHHMITIGAAGRQPDRRVLGRVFDRVRHQIREDLAQEAFVGGDHLRQIADPVDDAVAGLQLAEAAAELAQQRREIAVAVLATDLAVLEARRAQDALHQIGQPHHRRPDLGEHVLQLVLGHRRLPALQPLGVAVDDRERRAEFVRHHRDELALQAAELALLVQAATSPSRYCVTAS